MDGELSSVRSSWSRPSHLFALARAQTFGQNPSQVHPAPSAAGYGEAVAGFDQWRALVSDEAGPGERQATFRDVFSHAEFRALYVANVLAWIGNYLAKVAVTALVFDKTESVALSAATFALSYLPWLVGGPFLAALAERHRYRAVMVACDVAQMVLIGTVALISMPTAAIMVLLFLASLAAPPAQAAKSAALPQILPGDRLVVGLSVNLTTGQVAQVVGYVAGGALSVLRPRLALLINAATFAASAVIIRLGLHDRPSAMTMAHRSHLIRETGEGFAIIWASPVLRAIQILVFTSMLFAIVPEGLAAGWAGKLVDGESEREFVQGVIMAANPVGQMVGALLIARLVRPPVRRRLIRPFAVLAPLSLVPALLHPNVAGIVAMAAICGFAVAGMMPALNALFVQALPDGYRARAFGVMQAGVQIMQGLAILGTGLLASRFDLSTVVGLWSVAGVLLIAVAAARWPSSEQFAAATLAAVERNWADQGEAAAPARASAAPAPKPGSPARAAHAPGVGSAA
jgi:MFS family permease